MKITKHLSVDMVHNGVPAVVDVMQGDEGSRAVAVSLYAAGVPWLPPDTSAVSVSFVKPDKTSGWYDTLPDGSAACSVDGNIVTAVLVPEITQLSGDVPCVIIFRDEATLAQLSAFPFTVRVNKNPAAGSSVSNSYYNVQSLEQLNAVLGDISTALDHIIALQEELIGGTTETLITFTIDGTEHTAVEGMTWVEWCESEYNTPGLSVAAPYVMYSTSGGSKTMGATDTSADGSWVLVTSDEQIRVGGNYVLK